MIAALLALVLAAPGIDINVAARSIRPGELVVLTLTLDEQASEVTVRAFGGPVPVYRLRAGMWQALVGIDLDRKPGTYKVAVEAHVGPAVIRADEMLVVKPRTFATRTLRVDPAFVNPPEGFVVQAGDDAVVVAESLGGLSPLEMDNALD